MKQFHPSPGCLFGCQPRLQGDIFSMALCHMPWRGYKVKSGPGGGAHAWCAGGPGLRGSESGEVDIRKYVEQ